MRLSRRFQKIDVVEPTVEETVLILRGLKSRFEEHHGVKYVAAALVAAAELSARFINDRHLPTRRSTSSTRRARLSASSPSRAKKKIIGKHEIEEIIAKITRIPAQTVSSDDRNSLKNLGRDLKAVVFGQNKAIDALSAAIKMAEAVSATRRSRSAASCSRARPASARPRLRASWLTPMGVELIRFDMSEYMERHAVSRLIGAPPGYVGFDRVGCLTEAITKHPYSCCCWTKSKKAHPDVFNIMLQVMDHGTLTDNNGRKADFRNVWSS